MVRASGRRFSIGMCRVISEFELMRAATAGDLQRTGESVVHILETCRAKDLI